MVFPQQIYVEDIQLEPQPKSVEEKIENIFGSEAEVMKKIFTCESGLKQFNQKGEVIKSHTGDYGIAQINALSWDKTAQELGLDYKNSEDDNLKLAKHILDTSGKSAWVCYKKII